MPALLDKRLVFVTGKGGVGKTTVAVALGLAAARHGQAHRSSARWPAGAMRRCSARGSATRAELHHGCRDLDPRARRCEEYLRYQLKSRTLAGAAGRQQPVPVPRRRGARAARARRRSARSGSSRSSSRAHGDAAPYDLVIVDAPATGHGLGDAARAEHVPRHRARRARSAARPSTIDAFLRDPAPDRRARGRAARGDAGERDARVRARRSTDELGMEIDAVVVNALLPGALHGRRRPSASRAVDRRHGRVATRGAARGAVGAHAARARQREQLRAAAARGRRARDELPFLFEPELGRDELERLSAELERRAVSVGELARRARRSASAPAPAASARPRRPRRSRSGMAARGLKVAVLTIDPAKRLANSLGLPELGNEERLVEGRRATASCGR